MSRNIWEKLIISKQSHNNGIYLLSIIIEINHFEKIYNS